MSLDEKNIKVFQNDCLVNYQNLVNVDFTNCKQLVKFDEKSFENAFLLRNIIFPPNIEVIRGFNNCTSLVSLNFSDCDRLQKIGGKAFENAWSLEQIIFPPNIQIIEGFTYCTNLFSLDISNCSKLKQFDNVIM